MALLQISGVIQMAEKTVIDAMWDDSPIDVSTEETSSGPSQISYVGLIGATNIRMSSNVLEILISEERGLNFGEEIDKMDSWEGAQLNTAKEILAFELTKLVHGEEEAQKAQASAKALFSSGNAADMPSVTLTEEDFTDGSIDILALLVKSGLTPSRSEARRAVEQGGVSVDGEKVSDTKTTYQTDDFSEGMVLKKGKKNFRKILK